MGVGDPSFHLAPANQCVPIRPFGNPVTHLHSFDLIFVEPAGLGYSVAIGIRARDFDDAAAGDAYRVILPFAVGQQGGVVLVAASVVRLA